MSFSDDLLLAAVCLGAILLACLLGGGFWCGLFLFARLAETLFRRLPWQPWVWVYSLGIICCLPDCAVNYAGGSAALMNAGVRHLRPALPAGLTSWPSFLFFVLPLLCNWAAWALCRLEPVPLVPASSPFLPSEDVWPPPPAAAQVPKKPSEVQERRGRWTISPR